MTIVLYNAEQAQAVRHTGERIVFQCAVCRQIKPTADSGGTGYGKSGNDLICYDCCGRRDRWSMQAGEPITLYFTHGGLAFGKPESNPPAITNWPGTMRFPVQSYRRFRHPFTREAYCGSFYGPDGKLWRFKNIGDSQIAHCRPARA